MLVDTVVILPLLTVGLDCSSRHARDIFRRKCFVLRLISVFISPNGFPSFQIAQLQNAYPLLSYLITSPHWRHVTGPAFRRTSSDAVKCGLSVSVSLQNNRHAGTSIAFQAMPTRLFLPSRPGRPRYLESLVTLHIFIALQI